MGMDTLPVADQLFTADDRAALQARLAACGVGHTLVYHHTLPTTMTVAAELAHDPTVRSGTLVLAERQEAGRGRMGRRWDAPAGLGLLVSVLLRPPHYALPLSHAPMLAGVALREAVVATCPELAPVVALKWPNDLIIVAAPDQHQKAGGVIAESVLTAEGAPSQLILGIGVNANQTQADLPRVAPPSLRPTSLRLACGHTVDRVRLLEQLCLRLDHWLGQPAAALHAAWRDSLLTLGCEVTVHATSHHDPVGDFTGYAEAVTEDGGLVVRLPDGTPRVVHAADVSVRVKSVDAS